jgi:hypothetical protein
MVKAIVVSSLIASAMFGILEIFELHDIGGLSILVFFLSFFILSTSFMRKDRFVLWLRHFQERDQHQLRLNIPLFWCSDLFIPITLRDSSFGASIGSAYFRLASRGLFLFPIVVMPMFFLISLVLILVISRLDFLSDKIIPLLVIIAFLLSIVPVVTYLYIKRKSFGLPGWYQLSILSPTLQVDFIINKTLQRGYPFADSVIIQCPDEVWREVVKFVVEKSSIVLIDVSELTDNLIWEIETSLGMKNLETIIITCGIKIGAIQQLPYLINEKLEIIIGRNNSSRLRVFYYPAEHPPFGWKRIKLYWKISRKLREELLRTDFH